MNITIQRYFLIVVLLFLAFVSLKAQPALPNRTISLRATQALSFGSFCVGASGGTVTITPQGSRSSTGTIALINSGSTYNAAVFEITLCQGRNVRLNIPEVITLSGSNGGTLYLTLSPDKGAGGVPFPVLGNCNFITPLYMGGTLTVAAGAVAGVYTGSFDITFNQE